MIQTRLSDFHKIVVTVTKITYKNLDPRIIHDRSFKYSYNEILDCHAHKKQVTEGRLFTLE